MPSVRTDVRRGTSKDWEGKSYRWREFGDAVAVVWSLSHEQIEAMRFVAPYARFTFIATTTPLPSGSLGCWVVRN